VLCPSSPSLCLFIQTPLLLNQKSTYLPMIFPNSTGDGDDNGHESVRRIVSQSACWKEFKSISRISEYGAGASYGIGWMLLLLLALQQHSRSTTEEKSDEIVAIGVQHTIPGLFISFSMLCMNSFSWRALNGHHNQNGNGAYGDTHDEYLVLQRAHRKAIFCLLVSIVVILVAITLAFAIMHGADVIQQTLFAMHCLSLLAAAVWVRVSRLL
jgi:hypothetical protein